MKTRTIIALILSLSALSALNAASYEEDYQKLQTKWSVKRAKEKMKVAQKLELEKFKAAQKRQKLEAELGIIENSIKPTK